MPRPEPEDAPLPDVIGSSLPMRKVARLTRLAAPTHANVLIIGETGTGKELIARSVHRLSKRADGPYVRVNCGALSESLLESELFGHVKGAFTGAVDNKTGRFEAAHSGTIFLDEISSMSFRLQVKLLRVLQEREFERVGDSRTVRVDVRVVAATNEALEDQIEKGEFRDDLYHRLNVVPIYLPPLRERRDDVPPLAKFFLQRYCDQNRRDMPELPEAISRGLLEYDWPGNVRELENYMERLVVFSNGRGLMSDLIGAPGQEVHRLKGSKPRTPKGVPELITELVRAALAAYPDDRKLHERLVYGGVERELIEQVMRQCDGKQIKAADRLGINRNTLHQKLLKHGQTPAGDAAAERG